MRAFRRTRVLSHACLLMEGVAKSARSWESGRPLLRKREAKYHKQASHICLTLVPSWCDKLTKLVQILATNENLTWWALGGNVVPRKRVVLWGKLWCQSGSQFPKCFWKCMFHWTILAPTGKSMDLKAPKQRICYTDVDDRFIGANYMPVHTNSMIGIPGSNVVGCRWITQTDTMT